MKYHIAGKEKQMNLTTLKEADIQESICIKCTKRQNQTILFRGIHIHDS